MSNKLEMILRHLGRELADYQVCRFYKIPEEMQQTPCDFIGFTAIGRAILIEAKMVNRTALPINDSSNGLSLHQWNELCDANRAGALALICWARQGIVKTFGIDMAIALSKDRRSIPWDGIPETLGRDLSIEHRLRILDHWLPVPSTATR